MNKRASTLAAFFLAFGISLIWTFFNRYEYVGNNVFLFDQINVFPLILWTVGLTLLYLVHTRVAAFSSLFRITVLYLISISLLEAFGYYVLNIHLNSTYPSLLHSGIIHAPLHMKIFYVLAGPVYIMLTDILLKRR